MNNAKKIWLIVAASLVVIGLLTVVVVMSIFGWDFKKLNSVKYETNTHIISDEFEKISIDTTTADIVFIPSTDGERRVECCEMKKAKHMVFVEDGALNVKVEDTRKWYDFLGINFGSAKITVYMPADEYNSLYINSSTGDVEIPNNFSFGSIDVSVSTGDVRCMASASGEMKIETTTGDITVGGARAASASLFVTTGDVKASNLAVDGDVIIGVSTGDINLTDVTCKNFVSRGSTGDVTLNRVIANESLSVHRSTGNVNLDSCDASELYIKTTTGDVLGSLLTEKVFIASANTGDVDVPKTVNGGRCEINTTTGDIRITIK
ncbi:MAG: DUF4097 domain-containing protein [Ruminococcaceae bacterium]|nr:DUF4097 domain-containing protein [Oscillospiraceae bacterium]